MITLSTYADFQELCDLIYELQEVEHLDDDAAFVAACAELPALLDLDLDARFAAARVVLFDERGYPARHLAT
jgi:hypothetical protein